MADREASPVPLEVRARLAELELELSEGKTFSSISERERCSPLSPLISRYLINTTSTTTTSTITIIRIGSVDH
jgi:hypothetical protein